MEHGGHRACACCTCTNGARVHSQGPLRDRPWEDSPCGDRPWGDRPGRPGWAPRSPIGAMPSPRVHHLPRRALGLGNRLGRTVLGLLRCNHIFVADHCRFRGQEVHFTQGC
jgi:hypothetical protein